MHNDEGKCFREMFSDTWPDSIKLFLEDFYRDFYLGKKMDSNAQFLISVCQAWKDLGNSIGSANIIDRMLRMEEAHQLTKKEDKPFLGLSSSILVISALNRFQPQPRVLFPDTL